MPLAAPYQLTKPCWPESATPFVLMIHAATEPWPVRYSAANTPKPRKTRVKKRLGVGCEFPHIQAEQLVRAVDQHQRFRFR